MDVVLASCELWVGWLDCMYALHGYLHAASSPFVLNCMCVSLGRCVPLRHMNVRLASSALFLSWPHCIYASLVPWLDCRYGLRGCMCAAILLLVLICMSDFPGLHVSPRRMDVLLAPFS